MFSILARDTRSEGVRSLRDLMADGELECCRHLHAPNLHASMIVDAMQAGKTCHLRKTICGLFSARTTRCRSQARPQSPACTSAYRRNGKHPRGDRQGLAGSSCCRRLESTRTAVTKTVGDPQGHQRQDFFMKGERATALAMRHTACAMGHSRRRFSDPDWDAIRWLQYFISSRSRRRHAARRSAFERDLRRRDVAACLRPDERAVLKSNPVDVRTGHAHRHLPDGTKATVFSRRMIMAASQPDRKPTPAAARCSPTSRRNTHMMSYQTNEEKLASVYSPKGRSEKTGWKHLPEEDGRAVICRKSRISMECVATGRQPLADLALAFEDDQGQLRRLLGRRRGPSRHTVRSRPQPAWPLAEASTPHLGGVIDDFGSGKTGSCVRILLGPNHRDMFAGICHHDRRRSAVLAESGVRRRRISRHSPGSCRRRMSSVSRPPCAPHQLETAVFRFWRRASTC